MRKIFKLLFLAALVLGACSSMEPENEFERYGSLLPPDFNLAKFSELNPDIAATQAIGEIAKKNEAWENQQKENKLSVAAINALKRKDDTLFWNGDGKAIAMTYFKWPENNINNVITENSPGRRVARDFWVGFNIYGEVDVELAFLENFLKNDVDSILIMQTYTKYSIEDGRPYRKCKNSELNDGVNEVRSKDMNGVIIGGTSSTPTYNYSKFFFCEDDNGKVRKATDFN